MADLPLGDARTSLSTLRDRLGKLERDLAYVRSTARLLARGAFAPGSIPTSAFEQPAAPGLVSLTATGFAVGTTSEVVLEGSVLVPPRMRRCVLDLTGRVYAVNPGAADYLSAQVEVGDQLGNALPVLAPAGGSALNVASYATVLADLEPNSTFTVRVRAWSASAEWAAGAAHTADLMGSLGWSS